MKKLFLLLLIINFACENSPPELENESLNTISHGPILGHVTESTIRIWARTLRPGFFLVRYHVKENPEAVQEKQVKITTRLEDDNTGWTTIEDLKPNAIYEYQVFTEDEKDGIGGTFKTLPSSDQYHHEDLNPEGLFNFKFEYGSCANQNPASGIGPSLPTYTTMLREVKDEIDFAVMNGDWLYEEKRDYPVSSWMKDQGLKDKEIPEIITYAPATVGVWENYKTYLSRGKNLSEWHREVPSYFTFDDHELVNDIWGAGTPGRRNRRAVFRDIGTVAWFDYLGWANPIGFSQDIYFGNAALKAGSDTLFDAKADFENLNWDEMSNLHVHWGTINDGQNDLAFDADELGRPNSMVYGIEKVIDKNRLLINPSAQVTSQDNYSIGRRSYSKFTVSNCDFFLLDTRSQRDWHDVTYRDKPGVSILGIEQRDWLMEEMENSEADFFFLFSSVPFMIPHIGGGGFEAAANKDDAWTVFLDEREKLISFWEKLDKPVFVLTGDLHNSFAIKITDQIWEFCSGPHNSVNHALSDEGNRPTTGLFKFDTREMDIRWSSSIRDDIPRLQRFHPFYCVVQINNVFNNPLKLGDERWVSFEYPQVIFQYFDGWTGELRYSEAVSARRK